MVKKGDTLIEVTIAIGIFSMIAIAIASVMSSGTSGSQTALETTLTREEIDAQAEALRFVQSAYVSSRNYAGSSSDSPYQRLWNKITSSAISPDSEYDIATKVAQYAPNSCDELYNNDSEDTNNIFAQKAFVLNTKQLSSGESAYISAIDPDTVSAFATTSTYPRLVFGDADDNESGDSLISTTVRDNLYRAEGIYVVAVKDSGTNMTGGGQSISAFYDFYIRTCWYGTDASRPSTISTVVRLYDPDIRPAN